MVELQNGLVVSSASFCVRNILKHIICSGKLKRHLAEQRSE